MAQTCDITTTPIRAEIKVDGNTLAETPDVVSFNVRRARGQMCATFNASVKIPSDSVNASSFVGDKIEIFAGKSNSKKKIFTGAIHKATINPIRTDSSKFMLTIAGKDVMWILEGQKINRRLRTYRDGGSPPERWGLVTGVTRDNSPTRATLAPKIYSEQPKATYNWNVPDVVHVLDAYGRTVDKKGSSVLGVIDAVLLPEEE